MIVTNIYRYQNIFQIFKIDFFLFDDSEQFLEVVIILRSHILHLSEEKAVEGESIRRVLKIQ